MDAVYTKMWDGHQFHQLAVHHLPGGAVGLDFDVPEGFDGLYSEMVEQIKPILDEFSVKHRLGLYWIYTTLGGLHVLFQCQFGGFVLALEAMKAVANLPGWSECSGHLSFCADAGAVILRVGCKPDRSFDIRPWFHNPPLSHAPQWVREHEQLLAQQLPVR